MERIPQNQEHPVQHSLRILRDRDGLGETTALLERLIVRRSKVRCQRPCQHTNLQTSVRDSYFLRQEVAALLFALGFVAASLPPVNFP